MLFLLLCGLFPHTHGYHYRRPFHSYRSSLSPYGSIYHGSHTFQANPEHHGTHYTFGKSQPESSYGTYTYENSQSYRNGHVQPYPWQTQWNNGWIVNSNDGSRRSGQDGKGQVGNGQNFPNQEKEEMFFSFEPTKKAEQDTYDNFQAAETITIPSTDEINKDDDSEPTPIPGETNHDDPDPLPFFAKSSDNEDSEPPQFPGKISDDDSEPPPFSGQISDDDDSEPSPFPGNIDDDDSYSISSGDSENPTTPGDTSDGMKNSDKISPYTNLDRICEVSKDAEEINEYNTDQSSIGNSDCVKISEASKPTDDIIEDKTDHASIGSSDSVKISEVSEDAEENNDDKTDHSSIGASDPVKISEVSKDAEKINEDKTDQSAIGNSDSVNISEVSKPVDDIYEDETDNSSIGTSDSVQISEVPKVAEEINEDKTDQSAIGNSDSVNISVVSKSTDDINEDKSNQSSIGNFDSVFITEILKPLFAQTMSRPVPKLGLLFAPSLQWHVGIYSKSFTPYMQICGGSLVKADVVLSAAHCFWNDNVGALRPGLFAVAAGKLLRPWEIEGEIYTQHSDIKDIKIPPRYRGGKTSFQDDIAIVLLTMALEYAPGVRPVCVSFDPELERGHLTSGNLGTIAGWGLTEPNGPPSQRLNYLQLPYVDIEECIRTAEDSFLKYITSDKICAGDQKSGRALCRGDSGGGLVYYSATVPYLHGIASTAPRDGNQCNAFAVASFTQVLAHRRFLVAHVPGIDEGCEELYVNATASVQDKTTGVPQENATETNIPTQLIEEDRIFTNPTLVHDTLMLKSEANEGPIKTNEEPIKTNEEPSKTNEEPSKTNEEPIKTNEKSKETYEESKETYEESNRRNEESTMINEEEVVMNVGSGERGVMRVLIDNSTKTIVCNCYCKK